MAKQTTFLMPTPKPTALLTCPVCEAVGEGEGWVPGSKTGVGLCPVCKRQSEGGATLAGRGGQG